MSIMETLHCIEHDGPFERERKRGVKPSTCPDCKQTAIEIAEAAALVVAATITQGVSDVAVAAIRAYREWNRTDAWLWQARAAGELDEDEFLALKRENVMPDYADLPDSDTWHLAERLNLI